MKAKVMDVFVVHDDRDFGSPKPKLKVVRAKARVYNTSARMHERLHAFHFRIQHEIGVSVFLTALDAIADYEKSLVEEERDIALKRAAFNKLQAG